MICCLVSNPVFAQEDARNSEPVATETKPETYQETFHRHRWLGLAATSVLALNVGLGIGMAVHGENKEFLNNDLNLAARALHMVSSLSLLGIGTYQFFDGHTMRKSRKDSDTKTTHGKWAHAYLGMLLVTGCLGVLSSHIFVQKPAARKILSTTHIGSGVATLGLQWMALINIPFGFE